MSALLAMACLFLSHVAQAQTAGQSRFASVYQIHGVVTASNASSNSTRELRAGDVVYVGEVIRASASSEAVLKTDDAGVIAVRPNAIFAIEKFAAKGNASDGQSLRILSGALRLITGWVGKIKKDSYRITTPSATVGIRGTDHEPFVLTAEMAVNLEQPEGTYDKVISGGTVLQSPVGQVAVDAGKVGFAPVVGTRRQRALLTALMPALLDRVPQFYVPGAFDDQLEALAKRSMDEAIQSGQVARAEANAAESLAAEPLQTNSAPAQTQATHAPLAAVPEVSIQNNSNPACPAKQIADQWLAELDGAIAQRNGQAFVQKFSPLARVTARIRKMDGTTVELHFTREELAASTLQALANLEQFASRRPVSSARDSDNCTRLHVEAVTIESGVRSGTPYRLESLEKYDLELSEGRWLAVRAVTEQR
jgi:hypothetical protein